MENLVFSFNLTVLFVLATVIFLVSYFLLRKFIFLWFDPLLIYTVFNSCSIALVVYLYFWEKQIKEFYLITFLLSTVGLFTGLILSSKQAIKNINVTNNSITTFKNYDLVFDVFVIISILILIISNVAMLVTLGTLPILSDNPSVAKVELYMGGWGLVRRIDLVLVNFVFSIALLKIFHPVVKINASKKIFYFVCILIGVLILVTMGSKSSLINILSSLFGIAMLNLFFNRNNLNNQVSSVNLKIIKTFGKYLFVIALTYMFIVIVKTGVQTSATNALITRMVGSGDTFYFFYVFDLYNRFHLGPMDFILHIINPLAGFFRLVPYEFPIGAYILNYISDIPLSGFGPNSQHPIEGLLYFGEKGVFFYSFFIGFIIAKMRLSLMMVVFKKPDYLRLMIYISVTAIAVDAVVDINYFFMLLYDILIFGSVLFTLSLIITSLLRKKIINEQN